MKKTYAFKTLGVLTFIFNALMSICALAVSIANSNFHITMAIYASVFFMAGVLGSGVCAVLLYIYYMKREKVIGVLADAVANTVVVLIFAKMILSGDGTNGFYKFTMFLALALAIIQLIALLRLDRVLHFDALDMYLPASKESYDSSLEQATIMDDQISEQSDHMQSSPAITVESIKQFLTSRNGKITLYVIAIVVCVFVGYKVWDVFFNKTTLDVFDGMTVDFYGYNGEGEAYINAPDIDYDLTNSEMTVFINDIDYEVENNGQLSNGDKVKVTAVYSKETAKKQKLVLKEEDQEFEVSGLTVKYQNAQEIDKNLYKLAYDTALKKANSYSEQAEFYKAYYLYEPEEKISQQDNRLIFVFKVPYQTYDWDHGENVTKTRFVSYYTEFDSSYSPDKEYVYSSSLYAIEGWEYLTDESQVFESLQKAYLSYSSSQDKIEEVTISGQ